MRTVTFNDFYVNDLKIEGTKTVTNEERNDDGLIYFTAELTGGKVTTSAGKEITHEFNRIRTWIEGEHTPRWRWDDVATITVNGETREIKLKGR